VDGVGRWVIRGFVVLVVVFGLAAGGAWVWYRSQAQSWAWWDPPAVLNVSGRHYDQAHLPPVTETEARRAGGAGTWTQIQTEFPMGWGVWAAVTTGLAPATVYLCSSARHCLDYRLAGHA